MARWLLFWLGTSQLVWECTGSCCVHYTARLLFLQNSSPDHLLRPSGPTVTLHPRWFSDVFLSCLQSRHCARMRRHWPAWERGPQLTGWLKKKVHTLHTHVGGPSPCVAATQYQLPLTKKYWGRGWKFRNLLRLVDFADCFHAHCSWFNIQTYCIAVFFYWRDPKLLKLL